MGAYRDNEGKPWVLPVVKKVSGRAVLMRPSVSSVTRVTHKATAFPSLPSPRVACGGYSGTSRSPLMLNTTDALPCRIVCAPAPSNQTTPHQAKAILQDQQDIDHEYLSIVGLPDFTKSSAKLIFGADSPAIKEDR